MANFIENLPEYSHQQGVTYKHVTLMSELSHAVERRGLMAVSGVEQEVACQAPAPAAHYDAVAALVGSPGVTEEDRLRLVLLYALRYERDGQAQVAALLRTLGEQGVEPHRLALLRFVLRHCRADARVADIFSDRTMSSRFASLAKQHLKVGGGGRRAGGWGEQMGAWRRCCPLPLPTGECQQHPLLSLHSAHCYSC
jgi:vacuolar protein sorting-associated protein 45